MERLQLKMREDRLIGLSILSGSRIRTNSSSDKSRKAQGISLAPHPIPPGKEGRKCPITGLFPDSDAIGAGLSPAAAAAATRAPAALVALQTDPDIAEEARVFAAVSGRGETVGHGQHVGNDGPSKSQSLTLVPLAVADGAHRPNEQTKRLVREVGGLPALVRFTTLFYDRQFADPHLDKFIRSHEDAHGTRFASWVVEKFGDGTPWTDERRTRPRTRLRIGDEVVHVSHDRSSAHFAAWHSPKREAHKWGDHFKPDDARVWMRLHFWAAREVGLFEHKAFMDYYIRFIGHFVSVYSSDAPPFTRESARWSADPQNIKRYVAGGNDMADVIDKPIQQALAELPPDERMYRGSRDPNRTWPYELARRG